MGLSVGVLYSKLKAVRGGACLLRAEGCVVLEGHLTHILFYQWQPPPPPHTHTHSSQQCVDTSKVLGHIFSLSVQEGGKGNAPVCV